MCFFNLHDCTFKLKNKSLMPCFIKILGHIKKTAWDSSVGYASKAVYMPWTMDSSWFTQEYLAPKPDWWADSKLYLLIYSKRELNISVLNFFSTDWHQRDWSANWEEKSLLSVIKVWVSGILLLSSNGVQWEAKNKTIKGVCFFHKVWNKHIFY